MYSQDEVSVHFFRHVIQEAGSSCEGGSVILSYHFEDMLHASVLQHFVWGREVG